MILRMVRNILRRRKKKEQPCSHLDMAAVHDALRDNYVKVLKEELEKPSEGLFVFYDQACEPFLIPPHWIKVRTQKELKEAEKLRREQ